MTYLLDAAGLAGAACVVAGMVLLTGPAGGLLTGGVMLLVAAILGGRRARGEVES